MQNPITDDNGLPQGPTGGPDSYPSNDAPPGYHWEWSNGGWQLVADAPGELTATKTTTAADNPPPGTTGSTAGGSTLNLSPFGGVFTAPQRQPMPTLPTIPGAPTPTLPDFPQAPAFQYDAFTAPSVDEALSDPSYAFRKSQGEDALQRWAAAKGTLNDSGTAHALLDYGQNAASQEYQNIWNRDFNAYGANQKNAIDTYNTNYQTQYMDPFTAKYKSALDMFTPKLQEWQQGIDMSKLGYTTQSNDVEHNNDLDYLNAWNQYLNQYDQWRDNRDTAIKLAGS